MRRVRLSWHALITCVGLDEMPMRFSIIQLLLLISCAATACASLKFANEVWWIVLSLFAMLVGVGIAVAILLGRSEIRTRAVGFAVGALAYCLLLWILGVWEFTPQNAKLPTSRMLIAMYFGAIRTVTSAPFSVEPDGDAFMKIGHLWWTIILGCVGGQVACLVRRRQSHSTSQRHAAKGDVGFGCHARRFPN